MTGRGFIPVDEYERRLLAETGERSPYLFTFKRLLMWARRD